MVMVTPRANEAIASRLAALNVDGGVHRPIVPQGSSYPAVAFALTSGQIVRGGLDRDTRIPTKQHTELFYEVTAWTPGTDDIPVFDICDGIEAQLDGFKTEVGGVRLSFLCVEEIQRTPQELNFFHTQQGWLVRCRGE